MKEVRIAVVGVGGMGSGHVKWIAKNPKARLVGLCEIDPAKARKAGEEHGLPVFSTPEELFDAVAPEAISIATPHYDHPLIAAKALERGIHVLTEKPVGVTVSGARIGVDAWKRRKSVQPGIVYAAMFQERTNPVHLQLKRLVEEGVLGKLSRVHWIHTKWFRSQFYYDNGDWRASWRGEGGGLLLNQCPHTLDLFQWLFGMPDRVTGRVSFGKHHDIEVEDEASALFERKDGLVGHFHASTGECPGTNRLEIVGELGKLVLEDGRLVHVENAVSTLRHLKESRTGFGIPGTTEKSVPLQASDSKRGLHENVLDQFLDAVRGEAAPVATAEDGLASLALGNAIVLSSLEGRTVSTAEVGGFDAHLDRLIAGSRFEKKKAEGSLDFASSWNVTPTA